MVAYTLRLPREDAVPRTPNQYAACLIAFLALLAGAASAQQVLSGTEELDFDRPEAWGMKYFTSVALLTSMGTPDDLEPGAIEVAMEGGWVPSLSTTERRIGFNGIKVEDLNKTSVFGRPRVNIGLPKRYVLTLSYIPPIEVSGVEPHLFSAAIARSVWRSETWRLGLRLYAQMGTVKGDFTCDADTVAAGADRVRNPFNCTAVSNDKATQNYLGLELNATRKTSGRWEPYFGLAINRLDMEFQVNAEYSGFIDNNLQRADGFTWSTTAGVSITTAERWRLVGEVFYSPLDVVRPPSTSSSNDALLNVRGMIAYRIR